VCSPAVDLEGEVGGGRRRIVRPAPPISYPGSAPKPDPGSQALWLSPGDAHGRTERLRSGRPTISTAGGGLQGHTGVLVQPVVRRRESFLRLSSVGCERRHHRAGEWHHAAGLLRLGFAEFQTRRIAAQGPLNAEGLGVQVDVRSVERQGFAATEPGGEHEPKERLEPVAPHGIHKTLRLGSGEVTCLLALGGWPSHLAGGVFT
jgi:hypothetical protein